MQQIMTNLGDLKRANDIGRRGSHRFIWAACPKCGKERWVQFYSGCTPYEICASCARKEQALLHPLIGELNPAWKGGHTRSQGYVHVKIYKDHPFFVMAKKDGYVIEHRLVMANFLNRPLLRSEQVHHKNGIRDDNRIENLELLSKASHTAIGQFCGKCELRKEIRLLRLQVRTLTQALQERLRI